MDERIWAAALTLFAVGPAARADNGVQIDALLCRKIVDDKPVEPTVRFPKDAASLHGYWKSRAAKAGMPVRTVWIAEDVGAAAPPNTKIDEAVVKLDGGTWVRLGTPWGTFSLSKPTNGWPVGRYRAEIWFGDKLVKTLKFSIG